MTTPKAPDAGQFIVTPSDLATKVGEWNAQGFHVLAPAIQVGTFASGYGVNASLVMLDPRVDGDGRGIDVYFDKTTMRGAGANDDPTEERAPTKIGLGRLSSAAGVSWVEPYGRVDPLTILNLWIYRVTGVYLAYDGTPQTIKGEKEIDYRDGSAQIGDWSIADWRALEAKNQQATGSDRKWAINGWSQNRVRQARTNGAERAETGALERAIRFAFPIKHRYTLAELTRPFVALRVCPMVDMADPDVRRMVADRQLGGVAALYAPSRALPPASERRSVIDVTPQPEPVPVAAAPPVAPPAAAPPPAPPAAPPPPMPTPPPGAGYIQRVERAQKPYGERHAKAGQVFSKWHVIDAAGVEHVTIRAALGDKAQRCHDEGIPVVIVSAPNNFREQEISDIKEAGTASNAPREQEPTLPRAGSFRL